MAKRNSHIYHPKIRGEYTEIWWYRYTDEHGKLQRKSSGSTGYKIAEELWLKEVQRVKDILAGRQVAHDPAKIENHTFGELCKEYKEFCIGKNQAWAGIKEYIVDMFEKRFGSDTPIAPLVSLMTLEKLQSDLIQNGSNSKANQARIDAGENSIPLKEKSVDKYVAVLKSMFRKAQGWKWIQKGLLEDALEDFEMFRPEGRMRFLSHAEVEKLVRNCGPVHLKRFVITAVHTGMRWGEINKLTWEPELDEKGHLKSGYVDLTHGFIVLPWGATKTKKNRRIPIDNTMRKLFASLSRRDDVPHVFYDPLTLGRYKSVKTSFKTACKNAKIKDYHFHDNRHTFASQYVMGNGELTTLQEILGHTTMEQTLKYVQLADKHRLKAVNVMDFMPGADLIPASTDIQLTYKQKKGLTVISQPLDFIGRGERI